MLQFMQADADGSGSMSLKEFLELTRQGKSAGVALPSSSGQAIESRLDALEAKVDAIAAHIERLCKDLKSTAA